MDNQLHNLKNKLKSIRFRYEYRLTFTNTSQSIYENKYAYIGIDFARNNSYQSLLIGKFIEFDKPNKNGVVFKSDARYYTWDYKPISIKHGGILV